MPGCSFAWGGCCRGRAVRNTGVGAPLSLLPVFRVVRCPGCRGAVVCVRRREAASGPCRLCFVPSVAPDIVGPLSARVSRFVLPVFRVVGRHHLCAAAGSGSRSVLSEFRCCRLSRERGLSSARGSRSVLRRASRVARGRHPRAAVGRTVRRSFAGRSAVASAAGNTSSGRRFRPAMPSVPFARYIGRRQGGSIRSSDLSRDAASGQDAAERSSLAAYCGAHRVRLRGALCGPVPIRGNRCRPACVLHPLRGAAPRRSTYSSPAASLATMRTPTASMPCAGRTGAIVSR